jgi:uncharacterized membrane-anchored protein
MKRKFIIYSIVFLFFAGGIMAQKLKPAHFEFGQDIILKTLTANP